MTTLTIGMPVFNAASTIRAALDSLLGQTFKNFKLIISDNASTDETFEIISQYTKIDQRIHCIRQIKNIGAAKNFLEVSRNISTPYFMWFASDDIMAPSFLETCINNLVSNADLDMAFTCIANIDSMGRQIRSYPRLFDLAGPNSFKTIYRYVTTPELFGKANLIYSIYRTKTFLRVINQCGLTAAWGSDMSFVLCGILKGGGISVSPKVLFYKRWVRDGDDGSLPMEIKIPENLLHQCCPLSHFNEYEHTMLLASKGSSYYWLICFLIRFRRRELEYLQKKIGLLPEYTSINIRRSFPRYLWDILISAFFVFKKLITIH